MAKTTKELNNNDLNNVSGGSSNLDKYLKVLTSKDKNNIIVDHGSETELVLKQSVEYEDDGNLHIIEREKDSPVVDAELYVNSPLN